MREKITDAEFEVIEPAKPRLGIWAWAHVALTLALVLPLMYFVVAPLVYGASYGWAKWLVYDVILSRPRP